MTGILEKKHPQTVFFKLFKKLGFHESIELLSSYPNQKVTQKQFYKDLEIDSYLNSFSRVWKDLTKFKLIAYELDENNDMVIRLTEKGRQLRKKIDELNELFMYDNNR
jgi:predicted transcriptional regulator